MRLDKFLSNNTLLSRKEVAKQIKQGNVKVNGAKAFCIDQKIDENTSQIELNGQIVKYEKYVYIMLNKPSGVVSATTDSSQKTVLDLIPLEYKKQGLFPCGRLDKDTLGLVILTNDGAGAHKLLSPKNHIEKTYNFKCAEVLKPKDILLLEQGIKLKDGYTTNPCKIELFSNTEGNITIIEGKYHEIKRMFGAIGNKITFLKRISFGSILLDKNLDYGQFRNLTQKESEIFKTQN